MASTLRSFTDFILQSRLRSLSVAFAITFIPLIGTLSIIITGLATLRKGTLEGFWVLIASTLPYILLASFQPMPMGLWVVGVIVISNLFTWAYAALLYRHGSFNLLLELTALIGIMTVVTVHVVKPDLDSWWGKQLTTYLTQAINHSKMAALNEDGPVEKSSNKQGANQDLLEPEAISFINAVKPYATGVFSASLLFTALMQLFIARWWQMALLKSSQLRQELHQIRLGPMAGIVFIIAIILSYFKIALAQDMLPVLYLTFSIAGLSVVHYSLSKFKGLGWLWLAAFYIALIGSWMVYHLPLGFQLIAMTGLLDVWFDWRGRLDKRFIH
jgi:hypothetical protein